MGIQLGNDRSDLGMSVTDAELSSPSRDCSASKRSTCCDARRHDDAPPHVRHERRQVAPARGQPPRLSRRTGGIGGGYGFRYFTIPSRTVELVDACVAAGTRCRSDHPVPPGVMIAIVADPDGNWVRVRPDD